MSVHSTLVTFPSGTVSGQARVVLSRTDADGTIVVLDETPFHPVDHTWPDQPGDVGSIDGQPVIDVVMGAIADDGETLALGTDIPVKRGEDGWTWLVAHRLGADATAPSEGATVTAEVDPGRRADLSRGHTACHLASLALNAAIAPLWSKPTREDALGNADFDARACQSSRIVANGSVDEYRLGKSLRKAGVDTATLVADIDRIRSDVDSTLAGWIARGGASHIDVDGPTIVDRRTWVADVGGTPARILCGGTHVADLAAFSAITVTFEMPDDATLVMRTVAVPA